MHIKLCSSDNRVLSSLLCQHCGYFLEEKLMRVNRFSIKLQCSNCFTEKPKIHWGTHIRSFYFFSNFWSTLLCPAAAAKSLQSCLTLCDPIDGSPPGSPIPGILEARTLEWVAISSSNAWKWKVKVKTLSRVWLLVTTWTTAYQAPPSWDRPGKSTGVGCHCLLCLSP